MMANQYIPRTVRSAEGLSQEEALSSLYEHPKFRPGTRIASLRRKGEIWVANLLEPKFAEFPPPDDGGDEDGDEGPPKKAPVPEASEDGGSDDGGSEPSEKKPPKKDGGEGEVLKLLHVLLDALGIDPGMIGGPPGGPGGPPPGPPGSPGPPGGPPPPHDGPGGPPPGAGGPPPGQPYGSKLKPGEVPNRPGMVPVGAPAFGSVKQADMGLADTMNPAQMEQMYNQAHPQQQPPGAPPIIPPQGQAPGTAQVLPPQGSPAQNPAGSQIFPGGIPPELQNMGVGGVPAGTFGSVNTFVASTEDPGREIKLATAKRNLEGLYAETGYKVKQIKRDGNFIRALLSVH